MSEMNFQQPNEMNEGKSKAKTFWKTVGIVALAVGLSILTIFVLYLNR